MRDARVTMGQGSLVVAERQDWPVGIKDTVAAVDVADQGAEAMSLTVRVTVTELATGREESHDLTDGVLVVTVKPSAPGDSAPTYAVAMSNHGDPLETHGE